MSGGLITSGDGPVVRCRLCQRRPAAGPCARCRASVCGDCTVLTDGGATLGDPASVAAALQVPFVAGIDTARLSTGMRVRVDASAGRVTVLAPVAAGELA